MTADALDFTDTIQSVALDHRLTVVREACGVLDRLGLSEDQCVALLAVSAEEFRVLRCGQDVTHIPAEQYLRALALTAIEDAVVRHYGDVEGFRGWMSTPNEGWLFKGLTPLDHLLRSDRTSFTRTRLEVEYALALESNRRAAQPNAALYLVNPT